MRISLCLSALAAIALFAPAARATPGHSIHAPHSSHVSHSAGRSIGNYHASGHTHYYHAPVRTYHTHYCYHSYVHHYSNYDGSTGRTTWLHGMVLGAGVPFEELNMQQHYHMDDPDALVNGVWMANPGGKPLDTTVSKRLLNTVSYTVNVGMSAVVAHIGRHAGLVTEADGALIYTHWHVGTTHYESDTWASDTAEALQFSVPVSLQYVWGGEIDHEHAFTFSVGGGGELDMGYGHYIASGAYFNYRPFLMAEVGYVGSIPIKLRATYYPASVPYLVNASTTLYKAQEASGNIDGNLGVNMTGGPTLSLSLILLCLWK